MSTKTIKFVEEFTDSPGGRYKNQGPFSGQEFRDNFLVPALREFDKVIVDLNGAYGYPVSFLDEAFGFAIEEVGIKVFKSKLQIVLDDDPAAKDVLARVISQRENLQAA